ncbi:MAG TPA: diacylglycerol kinase family protein [Polyangiaceae bacterium]|nr:diacylglycerol kinase family protein [Polyangiaceae bacterium]
MTRVAVVVNPRAGSGSAAKRLSELDSALRRLGIEFEILPTERRGHASELARQARERGCSVLGVLGGDGTLNEVAQAYLDASGAALAGPPIALLPSGTGGDFARACPFSPASLDAMLERLRARQVRGLDLGVLRLHDSGGRPFWRAFVNVVSAGISGEVDQRVERGPKWLGGKLAFFLATLGATLSYRNVPIEIEIDGQPWHQGPVLLVAIANGQFLGGGMRIAPGADWSDGLLDVVSVGDLPRSRFLASFPKVYRGAHLGLEAVRAQQGQRVALRAARAEQPILVDVDGETPGYLPLSAHVLPRALQLVVD